MKIQAVKIGGRRWVRTITQKETTCLFCKTQIPIGECFRAETKERMNRRGYRLCETCANRHWREWQQQRDVEYKKENPVIYIDCPFCNGKFRGKRYWRDFSISSCKCGAMVECVRANKGKPESAVFTSPKRLKH